MSVGQSGEISYQNIFKNQGTLEAEGAETLPPTTISVEALKKLETWGLTLEEIEGLRGFTSQFRYDLCPEKVSRLSQKPAELFNRKGRDFVNLPGFFDANGRLDGQCGDIGRQWVININESGLIRKINSGKNNQIVPAIYTGKSETHFCREGSTHVWNGLALVNQDGDAIDEIFFDAAFQTIHSKAETKYAQKTATYRLNKIESYENTEVPIGWIEIDGNSWNGIIPAVEVLGVSSDHEFGYSLGFLRDRRTSAIRIVLDRIYKDGSNDFYIIGNEGQILKSRDSALSSQGEDEIEKILKEATKLSFVKKAPTKNMVVWKRKDVYG